MGWVEFAAAYAVFLLAHMIPVRPGVRGRLVGLFGASGFTMAYSVLSLALLYWLVLAAGRAPFVPVWPWAPWQNHVVLATMLAVCLLLALSLGRPNPFSFGGSGNHRYDPARPGIVALTRHPILDALALWALAHLVANGDLAHVLLFGGFAGFALLGRRMIDRRKRRTTGEARTSLQPKKTEALGLLEDPGSLVLRSSAGIAAYILLLVLHAPLIGVDPLP